MRWNRDSQAAGRELKFRAHPRLTARASAHGEVAAGRQVAVSHGLPAPATAYPAKLLR